MIKAPPGYQWIKVTDLEQTIITDGADTYPWTECFFWWPVKTIGGENRFWEKGYKRKVWIAYGTGFHMEPAMQYATLFEFLKYGSD